MKWTTIVTSAALALLLVASFLVERPEHPHVWWESIPIPAFAAFLGLGGTWLLALAAKSVLGAWFARPRGYYDA